MKKYTKFCTTQSQITGHMLEKAILPVSPLQRNKIKTKSFLTKIKLLILLASSELLMV